MADCNNSNNDDNSPGSVGENAPNVNNTANNNNTIAPLSDQQIQSMGKQAQSMRKQSTYNIILPDDISDVSSAGEFGSGGGRDEAYVEETERPAKSAQKAKR